MVRSLLDGSEGMVVHEVTPGAFLTEKGMIILAFGEYLLEADPGSRVELVFADGQVKTWQPGVDWAALFQEDPPEVEPATEEGFEAEEPQASTTEKAGPV